MILVGKEDVAGGVVEAGNHGIGEANADVFRGFVEASRGDPLDVVKMTSGLAGDVVRV